MENIASRIKRLLLEDRHEVCKRLAAVDDDGLVDAIGLGGFHHFELLSEHCVLNIAERFLVEVIQTQFAPRDAFGVSDDLEYVVPIHRAVAIERMDAAGAPDAFESLGEGEDFEAVRRIC